MMADDDNDVTAAAAVGHVCRVRWTRLRHGEAGRWFIDLS